MGSPRSLRAEATLTVGTKLRFKLCDLVELLSGESATQCFNRLLEFLCTLSTRDGVIREALSARKGLSLFLSAYGFSARRAFYDGEKGVSEIAPDVELVGANADRCLHRAELHGETMWTVVALFVMQTTMLARTSTFP
jgi:hypothetical protein